MAIYRPCQSRTVLNCFIEWRSLIWFRDFLRDESQQQNLPHRDYDHCCRPLADISAAGWAWLTAREESAWSSRRWKSPGRSRASGWRHETRRRSRVCEAGRSGNTEKISPSCLERVINWRDLSYHSITTLKMTNWSIMTISTILVNQHYLILSLLSEHGKSWLKSNLGWQHIE